MTESDQKSDLHRYLKNAREAVVWKLDGLSEYDVRRPLTPTGTNLLGLVKHLALVEIGYFGDTFGRPFPDLPAWADPEEDMWAAADQSREDIIGLYRRAWEHADATITELALDAPGRVPWWGEHGDVTLHLILIHEIAETARHAGHADIVREVIDGAVGLREGTDNMPPVDQADWKSYYEKVEGAAREAAGLAASR
jgi:uncharacterized damage-inducible protein DinB